MFCTSNDENKTAARYSALLMMRIKPLIVSVLMIIAFLAGSGHFARADALDPICKNEPIAAWPPENPLLHPTPAPSGQKTESEKIADERTWKRFKYREIIAQVANQYKIDPQLIYATIMTESHGREYVYRFEPHLGEGSYCMGQILLSTAYKLGLRGSAAQLFDPQICIDMIGRYHRLMLDTHGNLTPVQLARAYNTGSPWKRPVWGHLIRFRQWMNETT